MALAIVKEWFPGPPTWHPETDMPDLSGRVAIVTGGNAGIGRETVKQLLIKNAKVYLAARSQTRANAAISELSAETGKQAIFLSLDLASLKSVDNAIKEFQSKEPALHMLFNSGGVVAPPISELTVEGYDLQFGVNVLGHAALTLGLIPQLEQGAKTSPDGKARVINVSSNGAYTPPTGGIQFNTLRGEGPERTKLGTFALYGQSKYGNWSFSNELARRYADRGIISNALHPGTVASDALRHVPRLVQAVMSTVQQSIPNGAITSLYVGTAPEASNISGKWFVPWGKQIDFVGPKIEGLDANLWQWIEEQLDEFHST